MPDPFALTRIRQRPLPGLVARCAVVAAASLSAPVRAQGAPEATSSAAAAIALEIDTSEATQALRILDNQAQHRPVEEADWRRLLATTPYRWLKARAASLGRYLSDGQVKTFLLSPAAREQREIWRRALKTCDKGTRAGDTARPAYLPSRHRACWNDRFRRWTPWRSTHLVEIL